MAQWYFRPNDFARKKTTCEGAQNTLRCFPIVPSPSISSVWTRLFSHQNKNVRSLYIDFILLIYKLRQRSFCFQTKKPLTGEISRSCYRIVSLGCQYITKYSEEKNKCYPRHGRDSNYYLMTFRDRFTTWKGNLSLKRNFFAVISPISTV